MSGPLQLRTLSLTLRSWADRLDAAQMSLPPDVAEARAVLREIAELGSRLWVTLQQQDLARNSGAIAANFVEGLVTDVLQRVGLAPIPPAPRGGGRGGKKR